MPLPWYLLDKHNNSVIATPVDPMGFNAIAIPDHDEKSDLHQIFNIQQILDCHRFKDIYMCPSTDIYAASHKDSCIASLYFADQLATAQQCELIPARYLSSASKINNFEFRLVIHKQTSFRIKDNRQSNPRTVTISKGMYDVTIPEYGWIKSPNMVIQPAHIQPQATIRVIGHLPHEINDVLKTYGKLPEPFHQEDRKRLAKIIEQDKMTKIQPTVKVHEIMEPHHAQYLLIINVNYSRYNHRWTRHFLHLGELQTTPTNARTQSFTLTPSFPMTRCNCVFDILKFNFDVSSLVSPPS